MADNLYTSNSKMKQCKLVEIGLLIVLTIMSDFVFGKVYESVYFSKKSRSNDRMIHSVLETNEDILIFGSSRAIHHYNPQIIADSLGMSCYNVGNGGQNIYYSLAVLESAIERYNPKIAILELMAIDFEKTKKTWDKEKLSILLPFVKRSPAAYKAILRRGQKEKIKLLSNIYPYNSLQYRMFRNNLLPLKNDIMGYIPIEGSWEGMLSKSEYNKAAELDVNKIKAIEDFINLCKENNIILLVTISPKYFLPQELSSNWLEIIDLISNKNSIKIIDNRFNDVFLEHKEYFRDPLHLNIDGSTLYTKMFSKQIKQILYNEHN